MILYNEIEPFAAQWLRNLSDAGHIASGSVDERSIRDLEAADVRDAVQFHAFAGIGVWSHALRLAGWPDGAPVWTGSCPCQPFSIAGPGKGEDDERHLWPEWLRLIKACLPSIVFGEQTQSPAGRAWLATVRAEMEALGYAFGAADLCAAGVGAPHIRQRLFFGAVRLPHSVSERWGGEHISAIDKGRCQSEVDGSREISRMGDPNSIRSGRDSGAILSAQAESPLKGIEAWRVADGAEFTGNVGGHWSTADWLVCRPEAENGPFKIRPVEPGTFPLAYGPPGRVGRLRAYGNAIVPQVAAEFVQAFIESLKETS